MSEPPEPARVDEEPVATARGAPPSSRRGRFAPVLYPNIYVWYVLVASLDIMLTWVILHFGGQEVNLLADHIIRRYGLPGTVIFKYGAVVLVVVICEFVGRARPHTGRRLAKAAIVLTMIPVAWALIQLAIAEPE
jgi:hypothetical protein